MTRMYMIYNSSFNAFARPGLQQCLLVMLCTCFISCELDPDFDPGGIVGDVEAKFSATKQTEPDCYAPCMVTFVNTSTGATQYTWGFGDGMTSYEVSPNHEFDVGGEYVVTLTARNASGVENFKMSNVSIKTPVTFAKTFGDANDQWGNAVILTDDGGYAIAGREVGVTDFYGYLLRTDADGNAVFGFPKKFNYGAGFEDLDQTDDGGFIITGQKDYLIVLLRTDAGGNAVGSFPLTYGDAGPSANLFGEAVVQLPDDGFGILGSSFNDSGRSGQKDMVYFRTNSSGVQIDVAYFNSDPSWSDETVGNWIFDGIDEFLAVGGSQPNGLSHSEFFVVKFDLDGNVVNSPVTFGGAGDDVLNSVCINPQGGYAATGYTYSSGTGQSDLFFVKLNPNGTPIISSQKTFGGPTKDSGSSIQPTKDGGFVIAGLTYSFGLGADDFYLIRLDNNGSLKFPAITLGGFMSDAAFDIKETSDRGFIIVGATESFGAGGTDVYLIKTDAKGRVL